MDQQHLALRRSQAAHHRAGIQVALQVSPGRQRDGHPGEDHRHLRGKAEEPLGPLQCAAQFGPRVAHVLQPLSPRQSGHHPRAKRGQRSGLAGEHQAVADTARRLHQARGRKVGGI